MSSTDEVVIATHIGQPRERAFELFTQSVDDWWQRTEDQHTAVISLDEGGLVASSSGTVEVIAHVAVWNPPSRLELDWHGPHSKPGDRVLVEFEDLGISTRVIIRHRRAGLAPAQADGGVIGLWWADRLAVIAEVSRRV